MLNVRVCTTCRNPKLHVRVYKDGQPGRDSFFYQNDFFVFAAELLNAGAITAAERDDLIDQAKTLGLVELPESEFVELIVKSLAEQSPSDRQEAIERLRAAGLADSALTAIAAALADVPPPPPEDPMKRRIDELVARLEGRGFLVKVVRF